MPPTDAEQLARRLRAAGCVFAEEEAALLLDEALVRDGAPAHGARAHDGAWLQEAVARRVAGAPLEQVVGWAAFAGLRLVVAPGAFVPRRRTELLARLAAERAARVTGRPPVVLDLCCGVGAVAAVVERDVPGAETWAADLDPGAASAARANLRRPERVVVGDLWAALPEALRGRLDVVAANAPYVPTAAIATLPPEAREHERRAALDGGPDGHAVQARVAAGAPAWLRPGGALLVETGEAQAEGTLRLLVAAGLTCRVERDDALDATVVVGVLRAS